MEIISKNYFKNFNYYWVTLQIQKNVSWLAKFIKTSKNSVLEEHWKADAVSWKYFRTIQDNQNLTKNIHQPGKNNKPGCKSCTFRSNLHLQNVLKFFKKILMFLIKIPVKNWLSVSFYSRFLGFLPLFRKSISLADKWSVQQQFFRFRGYVLEILLPDATACLICRAHVNGSPGPTS